jgi:hypothetical protein
VNAEATRSSPGSGANVPIIGPRTA